MEFVAVSVHLWKIMEIEIKCGFYLVKRTKYE